MSIVYPANIKEVSDRMLTDAQNELPGLNPFLRESAARAILISIAGRIFDVYKQQEKGQNELFPDSATAAELTFIRRFGLFKSLDVNPATVSAGFINATGTVGSIVPEGTSYFSENSIEYVTINGDKEIVEQTYAISTGNLTRSGTTATIVFETDHLLSSNMSITVAGANETEYNITATITVVDEVTVTYEVAGSPASPATGDITVTADHASVEVESVDAGSDKNLDSGAKLTLETPIPGVDDDAYVQYTGVTGGDDEETPDDYQLRVIDAYANAYSNSNDQTIEAFVKTVPFVDRVWIFDATPEPGQFEVYFTVHGEGSIIPDPLQLEAVKDVVLTVKPAPMLDEDVFVLAPDAVQVDFLFTSLVPNSQAMQDAIRDSLEQMFVSVPELAVNLSQDAYRSAIFQTINPETGEFVQSFSLATPTGDIAIGAGQLAVLGDINFNV
jgi:uncharacterized phage protein gp47/JayE